MLFCKVLQYENVLFSIKFSMALKYLREHERIRIINLPLCCKNYK